LDIVVKDSVFQLVLADLPVDAEHVTIKVTWDFDLDGGTQGGQVMKYFPSKAQATFRRDTAKAEDAVKKLGKDIERLSGIVDGLEKRTHGRLNKLEKKNDPDTAGLAD
jgi:hypothetical protein